MSRAKAIQDFGPKSGDDLYRRFHTMRGKARNAGIPFAWEVFDTFYRDLMASAPFGYHPSTHRLRFDLKALDPDGRLYGYCERTLVVVPIYQRRDERLLVSPPRTLALSEEFTLRLSLEIALRLGDHDGGPLDELVAKSVRAASALVAELEDADA